MYFRTIFMIVLCTLAIWQPAHAQHSPPRVRANDPEAPLQKNGDLDTSGCVLSVIPDSPSFTAGGRISVTVVLKNKGKLTIWMPNRLALLDCHVTVTRPDGHDAAKTAFYLQALSYLPDTSMRSLQLKPDQSLTERIDLSRAFDLSETGKYTINIARIIGKGGGFADAVVVPGPSLIINVNPDQEFAKATIN
jgi:hypothetical protein